ncbi:MAG: hypothetical protein AUJ98_10655 [Bacteroidetes bacterium CG2_30_33_31]|nr:MAG: hypothetical protein AUJ98_10655 [Bacteroidetes bacterium CG2_30_33_31]
MNNNDILRRLRYTFKLSDDNMIRIFALADAEVTRSEISDWLKKDDDEAFKEIHDKQLAIFLNGFINYRRGKKDGAQAIPEKSTNNNIILRKLKIALDLKDEDILDIFKLVDMQVSRHELSALFRKPIQSQYRVCKDQFLRNFLQGLQLKFHD